MIIGGLGVIGVEYVIYVNLFMIDVCVCFLGCFGCGVEFDGCIFFLVYACKCDAGFSEDVKFVVYY